MIFELFSADVSRTNIRISSSSIHLRHVVSPALSVKRRVLEGVSEQASEHDNYSFPTGCICMAARLKGNRGCMCSGAAIFLGDESSSKPDIGSHRHRVAVPSTLKTKHTHIYLHKHTHTC